MYDPTENMSWTLVIPKDSAERFIYFGESIPDVKYHHQPLIGGISDLKPGYLVKRTRFYAHELLLPLKGELSLKADGKIMKVSPGQIAFLPCDMIHDYASSNELCFLWFHIRLVLIPRDRAPGFFIRSARCLEEIKLLSELLFLEERRNPELSESTGRSLWHYLKSELFSSNNGNDHRYLRKIDQAFEKVRNHLDHPWTVTEIARLACMSESNFYIMTKELYSATPLGILRKMRLETAASLLLRSNDDLGVIAQTAGYSDSFSLSKAFKKYYKCSPKKFRTEYKKTDY